MVHWGIYSKVYGINQSSSLLDVSYFSLFGGGLPQDLMHDLLEGVAVHKLYLLLQHCIVDEKLFSLQHHNDCLTNFYYGYTETDKPSKVTSLSFV